MEQDETETVTHIIPFSNFCSVLERMSKKKETKTKLNYLKDFLEEYRRVFKLLHHTDKPSDAHGDSLFTIIRLLCPTLDRKRQSYGIKDTVLGRIFAKILGIDKKSSDGIKLYNYKNPEIGSSAGDITSVIYNVVQKRNSSTAATSSQVMLYELNYVLDELSKSGEKFDNAEAAKKNEAYQVQVLQSFVRKISPLECKWLAKIILKKLDIGLNDTAILKQVHQKAKELLETVSLEEVCQTLYDPSVEYTETGISLFRFFRPMLCERLTIQNEHSAEEIAKSFFIGSKKAPSSLPHPSFLIETKFDGERFQIHYSYNEESKEGTFKYFSRRGFDFTNSFSDTLTPRLRRCLKPSGPSSFIMDGEMMAYNYQSQGFTQKGLSIDVKRILSTNETHCPAYVAFDLIYLNGDNLSKVPLKTRVQMLANVLIPTESIYYVSKVEIGSGMEDVSSALEAAIERSEEGIVLKCPQSEYVTKRDSNWLKLKPEFVDGLRVDDLDLLIIGAYYSESRRRGGSVNSFLLGLIDNTTVIPLVEVGFGKLTYGERRNLVKDLVPHFIKREGKPKFKSRKRPDLLIEPTKSIILEVNASEILYSKEYELSYTLRFPVVQRVRRDKIWSDAMTVKEFQELRLSMKNGKLVRKRPSDPSEKSSSSNNKFFKKDIEFSSESDDDRGAPSHTPYCPKKINSKKGESSSSIQDIFIPFEDANENTNSEDLDSALSAKELIKKENEGAPDILIKTEGPSTSSAYKNSSDIFSSKVFCFIGGFEWKKEMEEKCKLAGGSIVKNPTSDLFAIVAQKMSHAISNKIKEGKFDIATASWFTSCIEKNKFIEFKPQDLIFSKKSTSDELSMRYDSYGDSYAEKTSVEGLRDLFDQIQKTSNDTVEKSEKTQKIENKSESGTDFDSDSEISSLVMKEVESFDPKLKEKLGKYNFLSGCKIAFLLNEDKKYSAKMFSLMTQVEFYGGKVTNDKNEHNVTHVISLNQNSNDSEDLVHYVKPSWIENCISQKRLLDEFPYTV